MTTASIDRFKKLFPLGQFDVRRFRPNIVIQTNTDELDFVENHWLGCQATTGTGVKLQVIGTCPRCVITTLFQGDLPHDTGILRTIAQHNQVESFTLAPGKILPVIAGVYAMVVHEGRVCQGDLIGLQSESL